MKLTSYLARTIFGLTILSIPAFAIWLAIEIMEKS